MTSARDLYMVVYSDVDALQEGRTSTTTTTTYQYHSHGVFVTAIVLGSMGLVCSLLSAFFIFHYRQHKIVSIAQPNFLYLVCFACMLISISLFFLSATIQGGSNNIADDDDHRLNASCVAQIWFEYIGDILLYMALFSKLWRIEKLSQFRRQTVLYKDVLLPFVAMMLAATAVLVAWTIHDPPVYGTVAFEDDDDENENDNTPQSRKTMKMCYRNPVYNNIMIALLIVSGAIALWMAWKTKHVRQDLSDSNRVTHTIICHMVIDVTTVAVLVPIANLVESFTLLTTTLVLAGFLTAMVPLGFVILPKLHYARVEETTGELPEGLDVIGRGTVRVTGLVVTTETKPELDITTTMESTVDPSSLSSS